jgi:hypothetical protein
MKPPLAQFQSDQRKDRKSIAKLNRHNQLVQGLDAIIRKRKAEDVAAQISAYMPIHDHPKPKKWWFW